MYAVRRIFGKLNDVYTVHLPFYNAMKCDIPPSYFSDMCLKNPFCKMKLLCSGNQTRASGHAHADIDIIKY